MPPVVVLIHSPLVGPFTWMPLADILRRKGITVVVPALYSTPANETPYWAQHAEAVARSLQEESPERPILLVGHSGAGPLLPAVRQALMRPAAGYLFVDAGWPVDGKSRLDLFEDDGAAAEFRKRAPYGFLPTWTDAELAPIIPDDDIRRRFVRDLRLLPLAVYEEPLPVFPGWPDAPCGYLRFGENPAYDAAFEQARRAGCPWLRLEGAHFHMLVDPAEVAGALLTLSNRMGLGLGR